MDGAFPEGFYATTNQTTQIRIGGKWIPVDKQEMDCGITVERETSKARCVPMSDIASGSTVVVGHMGVRVFPHERTQQDHAFAFMNSSVSTEKPKGAVIRQIAKELFDNRQGEGKTLLVGGLVSVLLFTSQRPFFSLSIKNHAMRLLEGLQGLTGVSGLFGDVLSYLRLFALGLSGAKLSATFNGLAASAWDAAGFGVIGAILIILLGHTLNLVLCIMSGVVHGLRLNCIEFFKWGLPEEGYPFRTFAKKATQS